jgi:hypothetical protein
VGDGFDGAGSVAPHQAVTADYETVDGELS